MPLICKRCGIAEWEGDVLMIGDIPLHQSEAECIKALKLALRQQKDNNNQLIEALIISGTARLGGGYARSN